MASILSLLLHKHFTHPLSPLKPFCLPIISFQKEIYTKRHESENHLALSSGTPMVSKSEGEPELWSVFFSPGFGSHREGEEEKRLERA